MTIFTHKAKTKNGNFWVEGFYVKSEGVDYIFTGEITEESGLKHFVKYEILPETLCRSLVYRDDTGKTICQNDVLQITLYGGTVFKYLFQWIDEGQEFNAIPLNEGDNIMRCNGYFTNFTSSVSWDDVVPNILQNVWGDNKETKIIGNIIDSPELISITYDATKHSNDF